MLLSLVNGLTMGAIYALMALAINIVFSTTKIVNFAHGEVIMMCAMIAFSFLSGGTSYILAMLLACAITVIISVVIYLLCVKPFGARLQFSTGWILTTMGAGIIMTNLAIIFWGSAPRGFPRLGGEEYINVFGHQLFPHQLWTVAVVLLVAFLFMLLLDKTALGREIKATSFSHDVTRLMGINAEAIVLMCFGLSGIVASVGAALIAPLTYVYPTMIATIALKGFGASIIGGMGDSRGAFIGGIGLGVVEALALSVMHVSAGYKDVICFAIIIVTMLIKPEGLMGVKYEKKV